MHFYSEKRSQEKGQRGVPVMPGGHGVNLVNAAHHPDENYPECHANQQPEFPQRWRHFTDEVQALKSPAIMTGPL